MEPAENSSDEPNSKPSAKDINVPKIQDVAENPPTGFKGIVTRIERQLTRDDFPDKPRDGATKLPATPANIAKMIEFHGVRLRYNVIKKKVTVTVPGLSGTRDNIDNSALTYVQSIGALYGFAKDDVQAMIGLLADQNAYNPVADWIRSKPWDVHDRLPQLYETVHEREGYPRELKEVLLYRWLLSAVAAALLPSGFHSRGVLTFQGAQSIGKTRWCKALVSDPVLADEVIKLDHSIDAGNKDSRFIAISHWVVELGELEGSLRRDITSLKGFITADGDRLRLPYHRLPSEYPRRTVFCATVNESDYLIDSSGNTRWWTIAVDRLDFEHDMDMQQLFAQLAEDFERGEQWWLTPREEQMLEAYNARHRRSSVIRDLVLERLDLDRIGDPANKPMAAGELLRELGIEKYNTAQARECGAILRQLLGDPKHSKGRDRWRVPLKRWQPDAERDDDDLY